MTPPSPGDPQVHSLSDLQDQFPESTLRGEDVPLRGLAGPGEGSESRAEVWLEGTVESRGPAVADADLEVGDAPSILFVPDLSENLRELLHLFEESSRRWGISPGAHVPEDLDAGDPVRVEAGAVLGPDVTLGDRVRIGANVTLRGEVELSDGVELYPGVQIVAPTVLGENTVVHSNTVIGADGYGYDQEDGRHKKIPQIGRVRIGSDVEIGASCTIDRATFGSTTIGSGTKLDDQVHIAHNCHIGEHCLMVGGSLLAGSVRLGDHVYVAGQAAIQDHVTVADRVKIGARAGVTKDVTEEGTVISGFPAHSHRDELKQQAILRKLPQFRDQFQDLKETVDRYLRDQDSNA